MKYNALCESEKTENSLTFPVSKYPKIRIFLIGNVDFLVFFFVQFMICLAPPQQKHLRNTFHYTTATYTKQKYQKLHTQETNSAQSMKLQELLR